MKKRYAGACAVALAVVASFGSRGWAGNQGDVFTPVLASVLAGETTPVLGSDGRRHVVYELLLSNATAAPATVERVDVVRADGGATLESFTGKAMTDLLRSLDAHPTKSASLAPSESKILLISVSLPGDEPVPPRLEHRVQASAAISPGSKKASQTSYTVAPLDLSKQPPPRFRPPLEGSGWLVLNGCCGASGAHRGAILPIDGALWDSQRFAIDWMRVDENGRMVRSGGDPAKAEDYVGYGVPVLAAAAGIVVATEDGLPDQIPGKLPDPSTITVANIDGNHVVIDHGGGVYTFYAHLQPGSVKVKTGEQVEAGSLLGRLGNTGNTSAPHLHFHAMAGSSPLASNGIPYTFESFELDGTIADADLDRALAGGQVASKAKTVRLSAALPLDLSRVDFTSGLGTTQGK